MPSTPTPDRFLSFAEVAQLLGLDVWTVKKGRCETSTIPRIKLGGRVLFSLNTVQEWMAAKAREAEEQKRRSELAVIDLLASKSQRRRAVERTLKTIINGGKYK
jgi:predicted DNA-binding transcriptional regulator AlpA